jgi:hypothetical protein
MILKLRNLNFYILHLYLAFLKSSFKESIFWTLSFESSEAEMNKL